ncbi:MAG: phosphoenolpyruvate--protein phosphotransferase [Acidiferrobacterales bacterium]|nr:phosphoenolpyruvate--protein phosphotransferase [Acidiferrobacterales bacterium]
MILLQGSGVGSGIAIGTAFVVDKAIVDTSIEAVGPERLETEVELLDLALKRTAESLRRTRAEVPANAPHEIDAFLEAHVLMVEDATLRDETVRIIYRESVSAVAALMIHRDDLVKVFDAMDDEYLRSKKDDVNQVISQIHRQLLVLLGDDDSRPEQDLSDYIVVAHELTPADTVLYMKMNMRAFATDLGSRISHVAILARSLQIPAVVGLHGEVGQIPHGATVAVDSQSGQVIVNPDETALRELTLRLQEYDRQHQRLLATRNLNSLTLDDFEVSLLANVELPSEIDAALESGASGVGLYRTEYLFMNREQSPTEEEQFESYRQVVQALKNVTIRTLDLGADKQVDGGRRQGKVAINPALGVRAVRFCLRSEDIFRTQLRAILRVAVYGEVKCMIPMLSNLEELTQVKAIVAQVADDLRAEGIEHDSAVPIGGMIEVPAAAITAEQFAQHLDFLSIGTNDLIQYTLAIDRVDDEVNYLYDPLHPSVLKLVRHTIQAGQKFDKPVSLCGEMASDSNYTRLLLGMGLRIFSMDPATLLEVKQVVRNSSVGQVVGQVDGIIECHDSSKRLELLDQLNRIDSADTRPQEPQTSQQPVRQIQ